MNHYRVTLQLRSRLRTPLEADTLWGHVAWGIRYRHGSSALTAWLERYSGSKPPLVISSPLPAGFLPAPLLPSPRGGVAAGSLTEFRARKQARKIAWVSQERWPELASALDQQALAACCGDPAHQPGALFAALSQTHATLNRLTVSTADDSGGQLFAESTLFPLAPRDTYHLWCLSPEPPEQVQQWLEDGLLGGYGRDAANGCGHLVVRDVTSIAAPTVPGANAFLLLGPAMPSAEDPPAALAQWTFRCGRLGGSYAVGLTNDGQVQRQKRPVRLLTRGSLLQVTAREEPTASGPRAIGQLIAGAHPDPAIRQYGLTVGWPCRLGGSALDFVEAGLSKGAAVA